MSFEYKNISYIRPMIVIIDCQQDDRDISYIKKVIKEIKHILSVVLT